MHTFFINTSSTAFDRYDDILEIEKENKRLLTLNNPIKRWMAIDRDSQKEGYTICAEKIAEIINKYKEVTGDYNLVLFVDMYDFPEYSGIKSNKLTNDEKKIRAEAIKNIIRFFIANTLVSTLSEIGYAPHDTLVIFEEEIINIENIQVNDTIEKYYELLGIDEKFLKTASDLSDNYEEFKKQTAPKTTDSLLLQIRKLYIDAMELSDNKTMELSKNSQYTSDFTEATQKVKTVSFATNRSAQRSNRSDSVKSNIMLYSYILNCTAKETIYNENADPNSNLTDNDVLNFDIFDDQTWKALKSHLLDKYYQCRGALDKVSDENEIPKILTEKSMIPKIAALDKNKFGINDAEEVTPAEGNKLLSLNGSLETDAKIDTGDGTVPKDILKEAEKIKNKSLGYLDTLEEAVDNALANYSQRSKKQEPLLKKRSVTIGGKETQRYGVSSKEADIDTVDKFSRKVYVSAMEKYAEANTASSVAIVDLENEYKKLDERIKEIDNTLKKLHFSIILLFLIVFAVFLIPFCITQSESILSSSNPFSLLIALTSVLLPCAILGVIFVSMGSKYKSMYETAWNEFKEAADKALESNRNAVDSYRKLLNFYIPALRYLYEYKLDVDFLNECYDMGENKLKHHKQKLYQRIESIGNILDDLDVITVEGNTVSFDIDFSTPFSVGDKNQTFYSILK